MIFHLLRAVFLRSTKRCGEHSVVMKTALPQMCCWKLASPDEKITSQRLHKGCQIGYDYIHSSGNIKKKHSNVFFLVSCVHFEFVTYLVMFLKSLVY